VIKRWQWTCWGRRPHFLVEGQWTGAGTKILSLCCPRWQVWSLDSFVILLGRFDTVGWASGIRPEKLEWWFVGVVICLERRLDYLHMVKLMPLHPRTPPSLASFKSRLVLRFWCRITQVVLEKRPLNGRIVVVQGRIIRHPTSHIVTLVWISPRLVFTCF